MPVSSLTEMAMANGTPVIMKKKDNLKKYIIALKFILSCKISRLKRLGTY